MECECRLKCDLVGIQKAECALCEMAEVGSVSGQEFARAMSKFFKKGRGINESIR